MPPRPDRMLPFLKSKQKREHQRFYLLPGMGGRAYHRKQRRFGIAAIIVGLLVSAALAAAMYFINTRMGK